MREVKTPKIKPAIPTNIQEIADSVAHLSSVGHVASVIVMSAETKADGIAHTSPQPLLRGYGIHVNVAWEKSPHFNNSIQSVRRALI